MERTSFLKFIQQKNEKYDVRKLSLQSMSTNTQQKSHNGIFHVESPAFNTQLPAFINRKVKNLKPYTNHFKRFNIQTTKITDSPKKWNEGNKVIINQNAQSQKIKSAKTSLLKQLGIGEQIKATEPMSKIPEISVYEQFLQKTSTMFTSSVIQNMYQTCVKKSAKLQQKENYQRSHRQQNQRNTENSPVPKNQRKSLGITSMKDYQQQKMSQKKGIKSMNQLPKSEETFLKTQKVCIIPNLTHFQHDDLGLQQDRNCAVMKKKFIPINQPLRNQAQTIKKSQSKKSQRFKQAQMNEIQDGLDTSSNSNMNIQARIKKDKQSSQSYQRNKHTTTLTSQSPKKQDHRIKNTNFAPKTFQKSSFGNNSGSQKPVKQSNQGLMDNSSGNNKEQKQKSNTLEIPVPTNVTAASYIVYQPSFSQNLKFNRLNEQNLKSTNKIFSNNRILASLNCKAVAQIASLTKIMTFLLTLEICEKLKFDSQSEKVRIGKFQANINGTSAQIKQGQIYTVQQLFYGLMLPSGNDASLALAIWAGKKLLIHELKQKQQNRRKFVTQTLITRNFSDGDSNDILQTTDQKKICLKKKKCYERFILQMNKKARALGMSKTTYANSHGLSNNLNKSCAFDLCILCEYCMHNEKFRKVVSTIEYKCSILYEQNPDSNQNEKKDSNPNHHIKVEEYQNNTNEQLDDVQHQNEHSDEESTQQLFDKQEITSERSKPFSVSSTNFTSQKSSQIVKGPITYGERQVKWQNTHKLLSKEQYIGIKTGITNTAGACLASCIKTKLNRCFIIIVLNSKKLNYRFKDTETLRKWVYKKEKIIQKVKQPQVQNQDQNIQENQSYNPEKQPSVNLFIQTQK